MIHIRYVMRNNLGNRVHRHLLMLTCFWKKYSKLVGGDIAETGVGPGSYNIRRTVWHVNCCSPKFNGGSGWGIFYASM